MMTEHELELRSWLSPDCVSDFDDMYYCRVLGAANNIRMIGKMYADLASSAGEKNLDGDALLARMEEISRYFIDKRGESSYAIVAAIRLMTAGLSELKGSPMEEVRRALTSAYRAYTEQSEHWTAQLREHLWEIVAPMDRVLLFDYSSTVNLVMQVAAEHGKELEVYVPESRILDGGHAYVRNGVALGHKVHYFPDAAIGHFAKEIDAAFIGAETFFPNGNAANTVGSDLTAIACRYYGKPLYVLTQLIKVDPRGSTEKTLYEDASAYFGLHLEEHLRETADLSTAGLVTVPAGLITAFITEEGILQPEELEVACGAFVKRMEEM